MNYVEAQNYINKIMELGSRPGINAVKELLSRFDNPQDKLKVIHVAGTNGKGSICTYLEYGFRELGLTVGRYISPTLFTYLERFQINGQEMSEDEFADIISEVKIKCDEMVSEGHLQPTTFEIETAIAFLYFLKNNVDVVILETGMGGREDATNVVRKPLATVFASISYDHMQFLGDTLYEIAKEKAGIMREGVPVIASHMPDCERKDADNMNADSVVKNESVVENAFATLKAEAEKINAPFYYADDLFTEETGFSYQYINNVHGNENSTSKKIVYKSRVINNPLFGEFQVYNLSVALNVVYILWDSICGINYDRKLNADKKSCDAYIDEEHINIRDEKEKIINSFISGVEKAKWPGRFEIISENPYIIRDGAHNLDAAKLLRQSVINEPSIPKKLHLIMGVFKDKEYEKMLAEILPIAKSFTAITPPNKARALNARDLCSAAEGVYENLLKNSFEKSDNDVLTDSNNILSKNQKYISFSYFDDNNSKEALKKAIASVKYEAGDGILVFGSLSLAGLFE